MSPSRPLQLGSVLWAELEDPMAIARFAPSSSLLPRPTSRPGSRCGVVAITTRLPDPLPDDHVSLPWDRQGKGARA